MPSTYNWQEMVINRLAMLGYSGHVFEGPIEDCIVFYYKNRKMCIEKSGDFLEDEEWKQMVEGTGLPRQYRVDGERFVSYTVKPKNPGESMQVRTVNLKDIRTISNIEMFHIADSVREVLTGYSKRINFKFHGELGELDALKIPYRIINDNTLEMDSWFMTALTRDDFYNLNPLKNIELIPAY